MNVLLQCQLVVIFVLTALLAFGAYEWNSAQLESLRVKLEDKHRHELDLLNQKIEQAEEKATVCERKATGWEEQATACEWKASACEAERKRLRNALEKLHQDFQKMRDEARARDRELDRHSDIYNTILSWVETIGEILEQTGVPALHQV